MTGKEAWIFVREPLILACLTATYDEDSDQNNLTPKPAIIKEQAEALAVVYHALMKLDGREK